MCLLFRLDYRFQVPFLLISLTRLEQRYDRIKSILIMVILIVLHLLNNKARNSRTLERIILNERESNTEVVNQLELLPLIRISFHRLLSG